MLLVGSAWELKGSRRECQWLWRVSRKTRCIESLCHIFSTLDIDLALIPIRIVDILFKFARIHKSIY